MFSDRATTTSTDDVDLLAIDLFATMVQQYEAFITLDATKIIAEKFKSANADEVLLALNVNICIYNFMFRLSWWFIEWIAWKKIMKFDMNICVIWIEGDTLKH